MRAHLSGAGAPPTARSTISQVAYKRFKLTAEDWRNRERWDGYHDAIGDMIDRTSTRYAPWALVEAEDKRWARVKVLETLGERLMAEL